MNKTQFWTLSSALLASTALASVANAGTVGRVTTGGLLSTTAVKIASTLFSGTASTANAVVIGNINGGANVGQKFSVSFTNSLPFSSKFNSTISLTGANFSTATTATVQVLVRQAAGTFVTTVSGACTVTPLTDKILIGNCSVTTDQLTLAGGGATLSGGYFMGGLQISAVTFNNASGLAGGTTPIQLSGSVSDSAQSTLIENITAGTIIVGAAPVSASLTAGGTGVADATVTPVVFSKLTAASGNTSLLLATISVTATGALGTDLSTLVASSDSVGGAVATQGAIASVAVTVTSALLSATTAINNLNVKTSGGTVVTITPAAFSGTTATVQLGAAGLTFAFSAAVYVTFTGTAAIPAVAAGTASVAFGPNTGSGHVVAVAGASGSVPAIISGGLQTEVNGFQASTNSAFPSFLRIHNNGSQTSGVLISVFNDATTSGVQLGSSFTSATIAPNSTLQLTAAQIEAGAGITSPSGQYTVKVAGGIVGYVQHILFNSADGSFADLSGFRNQAGANGGTP